MIRWTNQEDGHDLVTELVDLFIANASTEYITHIEVQEGRASNSTEWSPNLKQILYSQFMQSVRNGDVLLAIEDQKVVGFANVYFGTTTITVEDIVSAKKGIGTALLQEIEKAEGPFIADVGPNNTKAKRFMEKNGYKASTIVYTKEK